MQDVAKEVLKIARGGLERRGYDEQSFLTRLEVIAETGLTQVRVNSGWGVHMRQAAWDVSVVHWSEATELLK
jgi:gamma-glutamylcysteine synthetase